MKILCIHATAGAGHQKAAEAVYDALKARTSHRAVIVDALDHTSVAFKKSYKEGYAFLISRMPTVWSLAFHVTDWGWIQPLSRILRGAYNHLNAQHLEDFLIAESFDVVVASHFMSVEVVSRLKREDKIRSRLLTVVTDFDVHRMWVGSHVNHYAVASPWTQARLESFGVPPSRITVTGIPTHEKFNRVIDKTSVRRSLGLDPNVFTVLIATGSFGIGPIREILDKLNGIQAAVICGHNRSLYEDLSSTPRPNVKICGLVDNMQEMMAAADVMLTKPGGLSTSEALVRGLPMVFFSAIPGQEQGNVDVLSRYGIGVSPGSVNRIVAELQRWRDNPEILETQRSRIRRLVLPDAAGQIIKIIEGI